MGIGTTFLKAAAIGATLSLAPIAAHAVTVVSEGGSYNILSDDAFIGDVETGAGGAGSYMVEFFTIEDSLTAIANASITVIVAGTFTDLTMSWVDSQGIAMGTVLSSTPVTAPITTLETVFTFPSRAQNLVFSWSDSLAGASFDYDVSAIPVPAGGVLLLTALGGLGLARRKRKTA